MFHAPTQNNHEVMMQLMNMLLNNQQVPPSPAPAPPAPAPAPALPAPAPAPPALDQSALHAAQASEIVNDIAALQANLRCPPRSTPQPMTALKQVFLLITTSIVLPVDAVIMILQAAETNVRSIKMKQQ